MLEGGTLRGKRRWRAQLWLPAPYCLIALFAWMDFVKRPPDGLANLGLVLIVFPYTMLDDALGSWLNVRESVLMPSGHGYIRDHAIFFGGGVLFVTLLLFLAGTIIDWLSQR